LRIFVSISRLPKKLERSGMRFAGTSGFSFVVGDASRPLPGGFPRVPVDDCFHSHLPEPSGARPEECCGQAPLSSGLEADLSACFFRNARLRCSRREPRSEGGFDCLVAAEVPRPSHPPKRGMGRRTLDVPRPLVAVRIRSCAVAPMPASRRSSLRAFPILNARTLTMPKLVALRFCRSQPSQVTLLALSDHHQELSQTVVGLREPPSALCAVFPDAFTMLPLNEGFPFNCLSWGFPKMPLHRLKLRESTPGSRSPGPFEKGDAKPFLCSVHEVLRLLDGFLLLQPADVLQPAADPGVHRVSSCCEQDFPLVPFLPFEAFPPLVAWKPCVAALLPGRRQGALSCESEPSPSPFPSRPWRPFALPRLDRWTSGSCSTRRVRCAFGL